MAAGTVSRGLVRRVLTASEVIEALLRTAPAKEPVSIRARFSDIHTSKRARPTVVSD